jgi:hypothetical protein
MGKEEDRGTSNMEIFVRRVAMACTVMIMVGFTTAVLSGLAFLVRLTLSRT